MSKRMWIVATIVSLAWLALLITVVAIHYSEQQRIDAQAMADIRQCERGNLVRGWIRWDSRLNAGSPQLRAETADRLFPILDCETTQTLGTNVPLLPEAQILYIKTNIGSLILLDSEGTP